MPVSNEELGHAIKTILVAFFETRNATAVNNLNLTLTPPSVPVVPTPPVVTEPVVPTPPVVTEPVVPTPPIVSIPPKSKEVRFKVTFAYNENYEYFGNAKERSYNEMKSGFTDQHFQVLANGDIAYNVPAIGAVTDNAKYPRIEKRFYLVDPNNVTLNDDGFDIMENFTRGVDIWEHTQEFTLMSLHAKGKLVINQSHALEAPPDFKVVLSGDGQLRGLLKLTDASTIDDGLFDFTENKTKLLDLTKRHKLYTWFDGFTLKMSLNDQAPFIADFSTKKTKWYPKEGAYNAAPYPASIIFHKV